MLKIYMSHPVRGPLKDKATHDDMVANCKLSVGMANKIRDYLAMNYRDVDPEVYVPAEHEEFVHRTFTNGMLTVDQILHVDCQIIEEKYNDLLLVFVPYGPLVEGEGRSIELEHTRKCKIPSIMFKDMSEFKEKFTVFAEAKGYEYE
jgi:hypothetical protein